MPEPNTPNKPEPPESTEPPESVLVREHRLLRTLIDLIPAMLYVKDAQSRFLVCNVAVAPGNGHHSVRGDREDRLRLLPGANGRSLFG